MISKLITALAFIATSSSAFASAKPANLYACTGESVQVLYSSTSQQGTPHFSVTTKDGEESQTLHLSNITQDTTALGQLVTGYDPNIADATRAYSLQTRNVLVGDEGVTFDTMLIETFTGTFLPPEPMPGPRTCSTFTPVSCTASFVYF